MSSLFADHLANPSRLLFSFPAHTAIAAFLLVALAYLFIGRERKPLPPAPPEPKTLEGLLLGHVAGGLLTVSFGWLYVLSFVSQMQTGSPALCRVLMCTGTC